MSSVTLSVPEGYVLPAWYEKASPEHVAVVLDVATRLPAFVESAFTASNLSMQVSDALKTAMDCTSASELKDLKKETEARARESHERMSVVERQRAEAERERDALKSSFDSLLSLARKEEAASATQAAERKLDTLRRDFDKERTLRMQCEEKACAALREKCEALQAFSEETSALKAKIAQLETPIGRGCAGEVDVAQTLRDAGFTVQDTSTGEMKNQGYLDLLAWPEGCEDGQNMRIAIEVKNRKEVKRENISAFEEHVRKGLDNDLFDSAMFISIRAHIKRDTSVALDMYEDESKRGLIPVSWIGPEKGKHSVPLTQEQLETHAVLHACLLEHMHRMRGALGRVADAEGDEKLVQAFVEECGGVLNNIFTDLGKQAKAIDDLKVNLTSVRVQCIRMFMSLCQLNREATCLNRPITSPWLATYETAKRKLDTHTPAQIWNDCSKMKSVIEKTIGKDAMLQALEAEKRMKLTAQA